MDYQQIEFTRQGGIAIIKFNRPEVMNCVGPRTHEELLSSWQIFKTDDSLKVAIITGAGDKAFCSGGDLKAAMEGTLVGLSEQEKALHRQGKAPGILGPTRWTDQSRPLLSSLRWKGSIEFGSRRNLAA